jgi:hypothetical protein
MNLQRADLTNIPTAARRSEYAKLMIILRPRFLEVVGPNPSGSSLIKI